MTPTEPRFTKLGNETAHAMFANTFTSSDVPKAIADLQTANSTIQVGNVGFVSNVRVQFNITHTFDSDLSITLTSPGGSAVVLLVHHRGDSGDNFINTVLDDAAAVSITTAAAPFTGTFRPENPLSEFNGLDAQGTWTLSVRDNGLADVGTLNSWSLTLTTTDVSPLPPGVTFTSSDVPKAIADLQTANSTVQVGNVGFVSNVRVQFNITHTFDGDLSISLTSPAGSVVQLVNRRGSSGDNFTNTVLDDAARGSITTAAAPFTGTFRPENLLAVFNGLNAQGTWTLSVRDNEGEDVGTLNSWSLTLTTTDVSPLPPGVTFTSSDVPKAIRDFQTANSTIQVGSVGFVSNVRVQFNIAHTFDSDLSITLTSPSGLAVLVLVHRRGGSGDNFINTVLDDAGAVSITSAAAPFTGNFRPEDPLAVFNGLNAEGTWTLSVRDNHIVDVGMLNSWSLTLTTTDVAPPPPVPGVTFTSSDVPKVVPDLATVHSVLNVGDIGAITKLTVRFSITHTFDGNLNILLRSPEGLVRVLVQNGGDTGDNSLNTTLDDAAGSPIHFGSAPFAGPFRPRQPLAAFNGRQAGGTWTLIISDRNRGGGATLHSWSLTISTTNPNVAPTANAGANQTATRTSAAGANVTLNGTGSTDSDGTISTYEWLLNGSSIGTGAMRTHLFPLGIHVVTLRVTDDDGATDDDDVAITVQNSPPTVEIDEPQTLECVRGGAMASFFANATDVDGTISSYLWSTATTTATTAFIAPLGTTQVGITVTDNDNAQATASSSVRVVDTQDPTIAMNVSPTTLWPPNHQMVKVATGISASDACDSAPRLAVVVTSNGPVNSLGDGDTDVDWNVVANPNGTFDVWVRAERAGDGTGRIYTITATATDGSGNLASSTRTVTVPQSQARR